MSSVSVVDYTGLDRNGVCGLCKSKKATFSHGLWVDKMTVDDYQGLLFRNWARIGHICYLPLNEENCCTRYTIVCDAVHYEMSSSHKKVIKRLNRYLGGEKLSKEKVPGVKNSKKCKQNKEKSLEDYLNEEPEGGHLEVMLVRPAAALTDESFKLYRKYQVNVHGDRPEDVTREQFELKFSSPLLHKRSHPSSTTSFGSFHQQYRLDGRLIAVGVIDILPSCVSSVCCFYDPDFNFLSLGIYTALREIALAREMSESCLSSVSYCIGYFVPSCAKMSYMTSFRPSFLVCPETFAWCRLDSELLTLVKSEKCLRLNKFGIDEDQVTREDASDVLVLFNGARAMYSELRWITRGLDHDQVFEYARKVGKKLSQQMLLRRDASQG